MKKVSLLFFVGMFAAANSPFVAHADLTIANNAKSTFTIVLPTKAPTSVTAAAQELQRDIAESTKANITIQKEDAKINGPVISLGSTAQAQAAGITADGIADSGFRIVTKNGNLYIIGLDTVAKVNLSRKYYGDMTPQPDIPGPQYTKDGGWSNGTANGVYTFLEDYLNVRWLMPGDLGRDVPLKSTFTIPDVDRTDAPEFVYRMLGYLEKYPQDIPAVSRWHDHQKLGFSFRLNQNHNWKETVPADLFKTHPDWFAMVDGKRVPPGDRPKLETTNPELVQYYAEKAIAALKADPHMNTYSLSPSDSRGWSESPESKALYDPSPSTIFDPESKPGAPSITPLILKWYRDVSNAVAKEYPQGKSAGYIYQDYLYPPTKGGMTLPENFIPVIAPSFDYGYRLYRNDVQQKFDYVMSNWTKVAPPTWFYFDLPNQIMEPFNSGMLMPPGTSILNFVFPRLLKSHIKGAIFYGNTSWSNAALTNYIDAKLLWNPTLNANDLQHEWLTRAYGPQAGAVMEQYYQKLDGWFAEYYQKYDWEAYYAREPLFQNLFAPHYAEMEKLLLQAQAQPMTDIQKKRLQLIADNMIVLQWRLRNGGYIKNDVVSPLQRSSAQVAELIFKPNADFDLFPILWYQNQPVQSPMKVSLDQAPAQSTTEEVPNAGYILLYASQADEINIKPANVNSGSAFVGYRIYEPKSNTQFRLMQEGLFYTGGTITFTAKANSLYLLRITTQGFVSPKLDYDLSIPGATMATEEFQNGTLYLQGKSASLYVYIPKGLDVSGRNDAGGIALSTQSPANVARSLEIQKHAGTKVLLTLDDNWRFHTDPQKTGLQQNFINADYNDQSWKTITATDNWQNQGFANFHGTAWYRKTFAAPALPNNGKVLLYFGAVDGDAVVYVNGQKVGEHLLKENGTGWDQPFAFDVTGMIKPGKNIIAVQVTKNDHASGIYNGVALLNE